MIVSNALEYGPQIHSMSLYIIWAVVISMLKVIVVSNSAMYNLCKCIHFLFGSQNYELNRGRLDSFDHLSSRAIAVTECRYQNL